MENVYMYEFFMTIMVCGLAVSIFNIVSGKPEIRQEESTNEILKDIRQYEHIIFLKDLNDK
jgi:hypothetical protein